MLEEFKKYVDNFYTNDKEADWGIKLKYDHSLRVKNIMEEMAKSFNQTKEEIEIAFKNVPTFSTVENIDIINMLVDSEIASSKREAREFVNAGSITINEEKITDENYIITKNLAIDNEILVVRRGKKKYFIGKIS